MNMFNIGKSSMIKPVITALIIKILLNVLGGVQILNSRRYTSAGRNTHTMTDVIL